MKKAAPLHPLPTPKTPWEEISIDVIEPLPKSEDKDAILVVVDRFSKMIRLMATTTSISSSEIARIYQDDIWKIHGIPKKIISNRGPQFTSIFMGELCKALEIKRAMSTVYYPQTDGQTERINQEIEVFLRHYINYRQDDWTKWLATAEFQYNNKEHAVTRHSPFYVNYGRHPWKGNLIVKTEIPSLEDLLKKMETTREEAKTAMERTKETMKRQYDKRTRQSQGLKTGEQVWLEARNIQTNRSSKKLDQKRYGPFMIKEEIGQGAYRLELPKG